MDAIDGSEDPNDGRRPTTMLHGGTQTSCPKPHNSRASAVSKSQTITAGGFKMIKKSLLVVASMLPLPAFGWTPSLSLQVRTHKVPSFLCTSSFDYSSPSGWDNFYQDNAIFEWHSSVPLERIASYVPPSADCLMVGCGNSQLPEVVLSTCDQPRIILLDTSETCLTQLKKVYGSTVEYQCGDATKLSSLWKDEKQLDIIIDKGLADAILCGEGWNGPLETLFQGAATVLRNGSGIYLLISYKLPKSTKEFLTEVGEKVGLDWEFDLPDDSNHRVSVSLARKR
jgi:hypothetical protein